MAEFHYKKELYPKVVILKAVYHFTDVAYIHLDTDGCDYIVSILPKAGRQVDEKELENEVIAQLTRYEIYQQTKNIRELTLARAMASSIVDLGQHAETIEASMFKDHSTEDMLQDWFRSGEQ